MAAWKPTLMMVLELDWLIIVETGGLRMFEDWFRAIPFANCREEAMTVRA
jgi:hypothetical protein